MGQLIILQPRKIDRNTILSIFMSEERKENPHQQNILEALYKAILPEWDSIKRIKGFPKTSNKTSIFIWDLFRDFDSKYHKFSPNSGVPIMQGGLWFNCGWSTSENVEDWAVDLSNVILEF